MADQTESSIDIDASPEQIMAVIADLPAYPQWSDGIKAVEVLSVYEEDGRPADARFTLDAGIIRDTYTLEYDWQGDSQVTWTLLEAGSMVKGMDGVYELSAAGSSTSVRYRLAIDVNIPLVGKAMKRKAEQVIIDTALKGLKERVESGAAG